MSQSIEDYTGKHGKLVTGLLITLNILIYIGLFLSDQRGMAEISWLTELDWGANFLPATQDGQWWRLVSAVFLHFNLFHLTLNMWALWDVGRRIEGLFHPVAFLIIYIISGVVGNFFSLTFHKTFVVSLGASGAIFGLYGTLISFLWINRKTFDVGEFRIWFYGASAFSLVVIAAGFFINGIDNAAHIGGWLAGLLLGAIIKPQVGQALARSERNVGAFGLSAMVLAVFLAQPQSTYRWRDEKAVRVGIDEFLRSDQAIAERWNWLMSYGLTNDLSFDEMAELLDEQVADHYERSFEALSILPSEHTLPSFDTLSNVKNYAEHRAEVSETLVESLREGDVASVKSILEDISKKTKSDTDSIKP